MPCLRPAFLRWPELGLADVLVLALLERELHGLVAVVVEGATWVTGQGPAWTTVTAITLPSSSNSWVMPSFLPMMPVIITA